MTDSPRYCRICDSYGDHHTDRHTEMTAPKRIQRRRTKGWRMPEDAVYVGRPSGFGNPYRVGGFYILGDMFAFPIPTARSVEGDIGHGLRVQQCRTAEQAVVWFQAWALHAFGPAELRRLQGKNLACWCHTEQPCHADVLLELANGGGS